jgi:hypothetical protein
MSVFKAFIPPPIRLPCSGGNPPSEAYVSRILPVVVRCIVGIIPHTLKKELLLALDAAQQEHT